MATRFYIPSTGSAGASPVANSTWESTTNNLELPLTLTASGTPMFTDSGSLTAFSNNLLLTLVSPPLSGSQVINGSIKGQFKILATGGSNSYFRGEVYVVSNDGTYVSGTCFTQAGIGDGAYFSTTLTNKIFANGDVLTGVTGSDGDRIVIKVGCVHFSSGRTYELRIGDDDTVGNDLPENNTATDDYLPWIEFSANLAFQSEGGGGGSSISLDGSTAASGSSSGDAAIAKALDGSTAASGSSSGDAAIAKALDGSTAGTSTASGELSTTIWANDTLISHWKLGSFSGSDSQGRLDLTLSGSDTPTTSMVDATDLSGSSDLSAGYYTTTITDPTAITALHAGQPITISGYFRYSVANRTLFALVSDSGEYIARVQVNSSTSLRLDYTDTTATLRGVGVSQYSSFVSGKDYFFAFTITPAGPGSVRTYTLHILDLEKMQFVHYTLSATSAYGIFSTEPNSIDVWMNWNGTSDQDQIVDNLRLHSYALSFDQISDLVTSDLVAYSPPSALPTGSLVLDYAFGNGYNQASGSDATGNFDLVQLTTIDATSILDAGDSSGSADFRGSSRTGFRFGLDDSNLLGAFQDTYTLNLFFRPMGTAFNRTLYSVRDIDNNYIVAEIGTTTTGFRWRWSNGAGATHTVDVPYSYAAENEYFLSVTNAISGSTQDATYSILDVTAYKSGSGFSWSEASGSGGVFNSGDDDIQEFLTRSGRTSGLSYPGDLDQLRLYTKAFSQAELEDYITANVVPFGASEVLDGTTGGTAGVSGEAGIAKALDGTSAGAAGTAGSLDAWKPLEGSTTGVAGEAGSLGVQKALEGSSAAWSTLAGELTLVGVQDLQGTLVGTSSVQGDIGVARTFAGSLAGSGAFTGGSLGIARPLAGALGGLASLSGVMIAQRGLAGSGPGAGSVSATLINQHSFAGSISGVASHSAVLTVQVGSIPEKIITALSGAALCVGGTDGFACPEITDNSIPKNSLFCIEYGGLPPISMFSSPTDVVRPRSIQILVRDEVLTTGESKADDVWNALHNASISGVMRLSCVQASPIYLGFSENAHRWTINLVALTSEAG